MPHPELHGAGLSQRPAPDPRQLRDGADGGF
ncbi:hypothetical protein HEB94_001851 [Actinopolymorpha pittospori]|uniref:Uncharacterized protein n=1 Tax=Actinopolymorpha pittospori TaxID=648752 RepID=A0A927MTK2_9ACTN|nr:hypothetical protein [Actinopolymorpha pittospori]